MTPEPQLKTMTLSQARHDLNTLPKLLETSPEPIYVEHQGRLVMTILGMEAYTLLTGAIEFIKAQGQIDLFDQWLSSELEEPASTGKEEESEGDESLEEMDTALARAALETQIRNNPEIGESLLKNLDETKAWVEKVIQEVQENPETNTTP